VQVEKHREGMRKASLNTLVGSWSWRPPQQSLNPFPFHWTPPAAAVQQGRG